VVGGSLTIALSRLGKEWPPDSRTSSTPNDDHASKHPDPAIVQPAPLELPAGAPLSAKALVSRPAALDGVRSWTVETRSHRGPVFAVAYHPDGRQVAAAGDDGMIRLWETDTRRLLRLLVRHPRPVRSLAWSPRGRYLASAGDDGAVCLWEAATGRLLRTWQGHAGGIRAVAWAPGGEFLATGGEDGRVRLWRSRDGEALPAVLAHEAPVLAVAWSPDGKQLASAGRELTVRLWDVASGNSLWELRKHEVPAVTALAWSGDGKTLASAGYDSKIWLWDVATGKASGSIEPRFPVTALAWSARRDALCSGTVAGVQTWEASGRQLRTLGYHQGGIHTVAWSPDGTQVVSAGEDRTVQFWDPDRPASASIPGHPAGRAAVAWSPDGGTLAIAGCHDSVVRLWNAATREFRCLPAGEGGILPVAAWAPDGKTLATALEDGKVQLWSLAGARWSILAGHSSQVLDLAWSPKGKSLASASADGSIRLWDTEALTGRPLLEGCLSGTYAVAWSPDGESLACGLYGKVTICCTKGANPGQALGDFTGPVYALCWGPEGRFVAGDGMGDGAIRFWKAGSWEFERALQGHRAGASAVAWSADGATLASAGADARVRWWDARSGRLLGERSWHTAAVRSLSWKAKTDTLASAGEDGIVRIGGPREDAAEVVLVPLRDGRGFVLTPEGKGDYPPHGDEAFVVILQTDQGQEVLTFADFSLKFPGKDGPPHLLPAKK
jgi:WD40 repeat protein